MHVSVSLTKLATSPPETATSGAGTFLSQVQALEKQLKVNPTALQTVSPPLLHSVTSFL